MPGTSPGMTGERSERTPENARLWKPGRAPRKPSRNHLAARYAADGAARRRVSRVWGRGKANMQQRVGILAAAAALAVAFAAPAVAC